MIVSDRPPFQSILRIIVLVVFLGWMVIGSLAGGFVAKLIYDGNFLSDVAEFSLHPTLKNPLLLMQAVGAFIGLVMIPFYYVKIIEGKDPVGFFKNDPKWLTVIPALLIAVIGVGISISPSVEWNSTIELPTWMGAFGEWAKNSEENAGELIKFLTSDLSPLAFIFTFIVVAVLPGIGEELVFRGLIQTEFQRAIKNHHVAIWLSAMIFSAIHLQFFGFLPRMILGAFFGYLYYWSGNLLIPMIGHFLNNGIQMVAIYLYQNGIISMNLESPESAPLPLVAIAMIISIGLLYYLRNYFTSRSTLSGDIN